MKTMKSFEELHKALYDSDTQSVKSKQRNESKSPQEKANKKSKPKSKPQKKIKNKKPDKKKKKVSSKKKASVPYNLTFEQYTKLTLDQKKNFLISHGVKFVPFEPERTGYRQYAPKYINNPFKGGQGIIEVKPNIVCLDSFISKAAFAIIEDPKNQGDILEFFPITSVYINGFFATPLPYETNRKGNVNKSRNKNRKQDANMPYESNSEQNMTISCNDNTHDIDASYKDNNINTSSHHFTKRDFLVTVQAPYCVGNKEHTIKDIKGIVKYVDYNMKIETAFFYGAYCPTCRRYYILKSEYNRIRSMGIILCRIIKEYEYFDFDFNDEFGYFAPESILHMLGYNVTQRDGLSSTRRQHILQDIIDNEIFTKHEVAIHIDRQIRIHKYQDEYKYAVQKWTEDYNFVVRYEPRNIEEITTDRFIEKVRL